MKPDICNCDTIFYAGQFCTDVTNLVALVTPIASTIVFGTFLFIFCIICCFIITTILIIVSFVVFYQRKKKILLSKNKELSDRLLMMQDLNKIPFNLIKFDKKGIKIN
jgi:hypothetical protein